MDNMRLMTDEQFISEIVIIEDEELSRKFYLNSTVNSEINCQSFEFLFTLHKKDSWMKIEIHEFHTYHLFSLQCLISM